MALAGAHVIRIRLDELAPCSGSAPVPQLELGDGIPEWFHAVPYGTWVHPVVGRFTVGRPEAEAILANHTHKGIDLVVDWEHQTLATQANGQPAPAAGWVDRLELRENGIWAHVREWTPTASGQFERREYRYVSPVVLLNRDRHAGTSRGAGLHSIALTNVPFLAGDLEPLAAREPGSPMFSLLALLSLPATASEEEAIAKLKPILEGEEGRKAACKAVGVAETATKVEIDATDAKLAKQAELGAAVCRELKWADDAIPVDADARLARVLKHSGYVSIADHAAALRDAATQVQALNDDQLLADCRSRGLVTPAMEPWARKTIKNDRAGFEEWARTAPCSVPVHRSTTTQPLATAAALTPAEAAVCKQLGVDETKFKKEARS